MTSGDLKILVYNPGKIEEYLSYLSERVLDVNCIPCHDEDDLAKHIGEAEILFITNRFPSHHLGNAKKAKWIQTTSAGVERFTLDPNFPTHMTLTRVTTGYGEKIAEFVIGYLLALTQRISEIIDSQRAKRWKRVNMSWLMGETLGVAGLGAVGGVIAQRASCMQMRVIGYNRSRKDIPGVERCYLPGEFDEFLRRAKYLVIAFPVTEDTRGMFGMKEFKKMRRDACLINIARGAIVKEDELIAALKEGVIGGAVLDVFEQEPLPESSPLWEMENVLISPHDSGPSLISDNADFFLANLKRYRAGEPLVAVVDMEKKY